MAVLSLDITQRAPLAGGQPFGEVGPYEQIRGTLHFAIDPRDLEYQVITDLDLAAVEPDGLVHFSSDFFLAKPVSPPPGGTMVCDVINRGNRTVMRSLNEAEADRAGPQIEVGNGFLMRHGFSVAFCGRQHDVPGGIGVRVPEALDRGKRLRGQAFNQYQLDQPEQALPLAHGGHRPVPVCYLDDPTATLTVRENPDAPPTLIERSLWQFARVDGRVVPDPNYVYLSTGFEPGAIYEITYTTEGAPVIGLGFLAVRDCVSFLKYATEAEGNPCAGTVQYALGYGASQCGRFLRELLYLGLNADERGRLVFDGVFVHTGTSRRGEFNVRFGQPGTNILRSPSTLFPMTFGTQTDPITGETDGLLSRLEARRATPKIVASNASADYWWSGASLVHTDVAGAGDVEPPPSVRVYHLASAQHPPGIFPLTDRTPEWGRAQYPFNPVDLRPYLRAMLIQLDKWVRGAGEPPPSSYPRISDRTAVRREGIEERFRSIPGVRFPLVLPQRPRLDFGPEAERGVLHYPPKEGPPYATLVSAVDDDGNEIACACLTSESLSPLTLAGRFVIRTSALAAISCHNSGRLTHSRPRPRTGPLTAIRVSASTSATHLARPTSTGFVKRSRI